jgi:hypothetical protein
MRKMFNTDKKFIVQILKYHIKMVFFRLLPFGFGKTQFAVDMFVMVRSHTGKLAKCLATLK